MTDTATDPLHGVMRDNWRRCLCPTCLETRKRNRERLRQQRLTERDAAGLPRNGAQPSSVPVIRELMEKGWTRRDIARALDMHPDSIRPTREQGTAERHAMDLARLHAVNLPGDNSRPAWHDNAACVGMPIEVFFPSTGRSTAKALAVCARCPVRLECWATSVVWREQGVWAGRNRGHMQDQGAA